MRSIDHLHGLVLTVYTSAPALEHEIYIFMSYSLVVNGKGWGGLYIGPPLYSTTTDSLFHVELTVLQTMWLAAFAAFAALM